MKKKLFVNKYERITNDILNEKCKTYDILIYAKVRVADVLEIDHSGISSTLYSYALKSHFDFVIYNQSYDPIFSIEVDGTNHETDPGQIVNDRYKDTLCNKFELPLLRINSKHLYKTYRSFTLLGWLVDFWFLRERHFEAQENGSLPEDELFMPEAIYHEYDNPMEFPYDINYDMKTKVIQKYLNGELFEYCPRIWLGINKDGIYKGIGVFRLSETEGFTASSSIRSKNFPIFETEFLEMILTYELYEKLLDKRYKVEDISFINEKIYAYAEKNGWQSLGSYHSKPSNI